MTKDELITVNELSKTVDIFTKNEESILLFIPDPDDCYESEDGIHIKTISINGICYGRSTTCSLDIDKLTNDAKKLLIDTIYLEITSRRSELKKEFDSLKIMKDE